MGIRRDGIIFLEKSALLCPCMPTVDRYFICPAALFAVGLSFPGQEPSLISQWEKSGLSEERPQWYSCKAEKHGFSLRYSWPKNHTFLTSICQTQWRRAAEDPETAGLSIDGVSWSERAKNKSEAWRMSQRTRLIWEAGAGNLIPKESYKTGNDWIRCFSWHCMA